MQTYATLSPAGLRTHHTAFRLWEKAKRLGTWNPADIDLSKDATDWQRLSAPQQDVLLMLSSLFMAGEEAVTTELLPLLKVVADEGHLEDEMFLTSFLWEEAKHVDFFNRFRQEVTRETEDLHHYQQASYHHIFDQALPEAMHALYTDASPERQVVASVTYNMVVEGVLAETGYYSWYTILKQEGILPGTIEGIELIQRDESRHIRFGVYLLSRLIAEHGPGLWDTAQQTMATLIPYALGVFAESFAWAEEKYGFIPFDLDPSQFTGYASRQFQKRMARLEKATSLSLDTILFGDQ